MSAGGADEVDDVLIVGGGLAGFHTALALRRQGFAGEITVLGAEVHAPYDRPPLSKAFLVGALEAGDLSLDDADDPLDVTWVRGVLAEHLVQRTDAARGTRSGVRTGDGHELLADAVVLATGADAIRIGPSAPGAHVLRTLDDAERLRAEGLRDRDVVVVGTGFVGLEAAAAAVGLGARSVTVVGLETTPLADRLGHPVGASIQALHERNGVHFRLGATVTGLALDERGTVTGVRVAGLADPVPADLVVVGIGMRPTTGWLAGSVDAGELQLGPGGGVLCDSRGRTALPQVWAVGDCAQWAREDQPGHARSGHWQDSLDHAGVVAADVLGAASLPVPPPYFWSDQHDVRLQVAGHLQGDETAVVRAGSVAAADLLVTYERDGVETAVLGMDRPRDVMRWRRAHRPSGAPAIPTRTADPPGADVPGADLPESDLWRAAR